MCVHAVMCSCVCRRVCVRRFIPHGCSCPQRSPAIGLASVGLEGGALISEQAYGRKMTAFGRRPHARFPRCPVSIVDGRRFDRAAAQQTEFFRVACKGGDKEQPAALGCARGLDGGFPDRVGEIAADGGMRAGQVANMRHAQLPRQLLRDSVHGKDDRKADIRRGWQILPRGRHRHGKAVCVEFTWCGWVSCAGRGRAESL